MRRRFGTADRGFTLVELVLAVTITGILSTVLVAAITVSLKVTQRTGESLTSTARRTVLTNKLVADVRDSAALGLWDPTAKGWVVDPPADCAANQPDGAATPFLWTTDAIGTTVAYWRSPAVTPDDLTTIYRRACGSSDGSAPLAGWKNSPQGIQVACGTDLVEAPTAPSLLGCGLATGAELRAGIDLSETTAALAVADVVVGTAPVPDRALPEGTSFPLLIGDESIVATRNGGTLALTRGYPTTHAGGEPVLFAPTVVRIRIPVDPIADGDPDHYDLTIARRES